MKINKTCNSILIFLAAVAAVSGESFTVFTGTSTGSNSWFDETLWEGVTGYPNDVSDAVTMNNADTKAVIDNGAITIGSLIVAQTATNVELEISTSQALTVDTSVVIGEEAGSSGKIVANADSVFTINGNFTTGGSGSAVLQVIGATAVVHGEFSIGPFAVVELSDSAVIVAKGDQLEAFRNYLAADQILPNVGMQTYAIYDHTKDKTILRGPPSGMDRSYSCSGSGEITVVTEFFPGDRLQLGKSSSGELCTLVEVSSEAVSGRRILQVNPTALQMTPLGRSYNAYDWEPYGGDFANVQFDCTGGSSCFVRNLPPLREGRSYVLKHYSSPELSADNINARFLQKGTFGPTKSDITNFPSSPSDWLTSQFNMPITSHRAVFRSHLTHWHAESNYHTLLHTNACGEGARYRKYAFVHVDQYRDMTITVSPHNASKVILAVDGQTRTIADGPVQCGDWRGPDPDRTLSEGTYEICWNPLEGLEGRVRVKSQNPIDCDCDLFFGGVFGNPPVHFDSLHLPDLSAINLDGKTVSVLSDRFYFSDIQDEMLQVQSPLVDSSCDGVAPPGAPDQVIVGVTTDSDSNMEYWIHTTSFQLQTNEIQAPLPDGGKSLINVTADAPYERMKMACSSAPRTFLNEEHCVLSNNGCYDQEGPDVIINLNVTSLETIHSVTGGAGGVDVRYVYIVNDLRIDDVSKGDVGHPCVGGVRSRWVKVDDCSTSRVINNQTRDTFVQLLSLSNDVNNENLRDIFFPVSGLTCASSDVDEKDPNTYLFTIDVNGICWQNTHPDNHQVFDFTEWVFKHPGGEDAIKAFADVNNTFILKFPGTWHSMNRWVQGRDQSLISLGREGDNTTLKSLPPELLREDIAQAFGSHVGATAAASGKVVVCGSPFEVATVHDENSGPLYKGGFDMHTYYNFTNWGLKEQRRSIWLDIALNAPDQLRQRVAFALSQILVVADGAIGDDDRTESFLSFYDIFTRNAFGNYFDILKEVTYHPLMAEMLTYLNGESTGYAWAVYNTPTFLKPDENYAREIMQLFTIGLDQLHKNGTTVVDSAGYEVRTYTNKDITEYAKVYTGLRRRKMRGNIEDPREPGGWGNNQVDPMETNAWKKDHFPKLGLDRQYIGDGYPLCTDIPAQHFLKQGAKYRLLGSNPNPELLNDPNKIDWVDNWDRGSPKRLSLNFNSSALAAALCKGNVNDCQPSSIAILEQDIPCDGVECDVTEPRTFEVSPGIWFEYQRPPCVNLAFYKNPKTIFRNWYHDKVMCGNPESHDASTICCDATRPLSWGESAWRQELFGGERVDFQTAEARCDSGQDLRLCHFPWISNDDCSDPAQGGCDQWNLWYWTYNNCTQYIKINSEGAVAIVHEHGIPDQDNTRNYRMVRGDTKMYFGADWESSDQEVAEFLGDYEVNCVNTVGCSIDVADGICQCAVEVEHNQLFTMESEILSIDNIISKAKIGGFPTDSGEEVSGVPGVKKYPAGPLSADTVFEFVDMNGKTRYRKNVASKVLIGNAGALQIRTPVSFFNLPEFTTRDAQYELDAALEQYFYHPNMAPFLAKRLAQRFGISNPSPVYIEAIAVAFQTGKFESFGSGEYGCLKATIAAVLLHREAQDITLDADPAQGSILEPYLKLVHIMRSLEFKTRVDSPFLRFGRDIMEAIGQEAHKLPSVFSFFRPEYRPGGRIASAGLASPESQVLHGPTSVNTLNLFFSLIKYGWADCFGGGGRNQVNKFGWEHTRCRIGASTNWGENTYNPSNQNITSPEVIVDELAMLLTSGRLSDESRQLMLDVYNQTMNLGKGPYEAMINVQQLMVATPEFQTTNTPKTTGQSRTLHQPPPPTTFPYKNIIYVMLSGGADSYNMLVPNVCTGTNAANITVDQQYQLHRGVMAFVPGSSEFGVTISATGQPCSQFALHDELDFVKELYDRKQLLWVANSGVVNQNGMTKSNFNAKTKTQLFAHNAMQEETKKVDPYDEITGTGILGRANDVLQGKGHVINALNVDLAAIALDGVPGQSTPPIVISSSTIDSFAERPDGTDWRHTQDETYFEIENYVAQLNGQSDGFSGVFADRWSEVLLNGIQNSESMKEYLESANMDGNIWGSQPSDWEESRLWRQFQTVAKLAQTHENRTTDRDVFYVEYGGFDHHDSMKVNLRPKLRRLNANLRKLVGQLEQDQLWEDTVIYITSEFSRTITPNANAGSDHAYGQHVMVMGGSVKGGQILGHYPSDISPSSPLDDGSERGRFLPTTSNDAIWNSILQWYGVTDPTDLDYCLPNRQNTVNPVSQEVSGVGDLLSPLFMVDDMFTSGANGTTSESRRLR